MKQEIVKHCYSQETCFYPWFQLPCRTFGIAGNKLLSNYSGILQAKHKHAAHKAQRHACASGEINALKKKGWNHHSKGNHGGETNLYKDKKGNVYQKPDDCSNCEGEPLDINIKEVMKKVVNAGAMTAVGIATYETIKWGTAILLAPETGGLSIEAATIAP